MREIKFRAWDKRNREMIDWETIAVFDMAESLTLVDIITDKDEDFVVMQFTGLRDKNGKEIYEGDIVCDNYAENYPSDAREYVREHGGELEGINKNYRVCFGGFIDNIDGYADVPEWEKNEMSIVGWYLQEETGRVSLAGALYHSFGNYSSFRTNKIYHEVVGNIYENPELLEAKQ